MPTSSRSLRMADAEWNPLLIIFSNADGIEQESIPSAMKVAFFTRDAET